MNEGTALRPFRVRRFSLVISVLIIVILGWIDYVSGVDFRIYPLYFIPLAFGSWNRPAITSLMLSVYATAVWFFSNYLIGMRYSSNVVWVVNTASQLTTFILVSLAVAYIGRRFEFESELARTDALTGLLNSRAFYERMSFEVKRSHRYQRPIAVVYLDLDNFKEINDRLGHKAGDKILLRVARILRASLRDTDIVGRMGGDEFMLVLPEINSDSLEKVLERVRVKVKTIIGNDHKLHLSISAGAVVCIPNKETMEKLISFSDDLMYQVKRSGKDGIIIKEIA
jgi:diguanylate cyclase (GGDEF)-like protein